MSARPTPSTLLRFISLFLIVGVITLLISGFIALRPVISLLGDEVNRIFREWTIPKVNYSFKPAPRSSGFALLNENKSVGFKVLLGKTDAPKIPQARFEVKDSWLDFSLATNVGESGFKKVKGPVKDLIVWENALPDIDISYEMKADGLKEDIVLKNRRIITDDINKKNPYAFPFYITTYNVVPRYDLSGKLTPVFIDSKTGEYRFHIEKPYLVDANGVRYDSMEFELKPLDVALENTTKKSAFADSWTVPHSNEAAPDLSKPNISQQKQSVKSSVDLGGIAPPRTDLTGQAPHLSRPTPNSSYHSENPQKKLSLLGKLSFNQEVYAQDSDKNTSGSRYLLVLKLPHTWLADPSRAYPVLLDPTVTHNTQTAFATGYLNRVKDEGSADA